MPEGLEPGSPASCSGPASVVGDKWEQQGVADPEVLVGRLNAMHHELRQQGPPRRRGRRTSARPSE